MSDTDIKPIAIETLASTLRRTIYNAYLATLVGNPARITEVHAKRATNPQIGDMVIESTTIWRATCDLNGVGILEDIAEEKVHYDEEWDEELHRRPHPTERVFYIRTLDGRLFRWTNARMIAAVSDLKTLDLEALR